MLSAQPVLAATTPDPGAFDPAPAGTILGLVYLQHQRADDVYTQGERSRLGLDLDLAILRSVVFYDLAGRPANWQVIMPVAHQHISRSDSTVSGAGDLTVGGTVWTMSHAEKAEHLGWSAFLTMPTGQHNAQGLAVSNDRYALDLQVGYTRGLGGRWSMDLVGQSELYTRRHDTDTKTDPLWRAFASVRYAITERTCLAGVVRQTWGEEQERYGEIVSYSKNNTNLKLGINSSLTQRFHMQVMLAHDVHVENGSKLTGLETRFTYVF